MADNVNKPPHYNKGEIECINAIEASMTKEEFAGYLKGNVLKYVWRYNYKGKPKEDLDIPKEVPDMREPLGEWADQEIVIEDDQEEEVQEEEILAEPAPEPEPEPDQDIYDEKPKEEKRKREPGRGGGYWF